MCKQNPQRCARAHQQQRLRQSLPDQPPTPRANRQADCRVPLMRRRPRQHQVRHVYAGRQQHQAGQYQQRRQRSRKLRPQDAQSPGGGTHLHVIEQLPSYLRRDLDVRHVPLEQAVGFLAGLFRAHTRFEPRDRFQPQRRPVPHLRRIGKHHGNCHVDGTPRFRRHDFRWHDPNNRYRSLGLRNDTPDNARIAAESLLPVRAADHRHRAVGSALTWRLIVRRRQPAPHHRRHPEHLVKIAGYPHSADLFAPSVDHQFHVRRAERRHCFVAPGLVAQQLEVRVGRAVGHRARGPHKHQPPRFPNRKFAKHHGIRYPDDRRVGADAKRQRKHRHRRESRVGAKGAERQPHVRADFVHALQSPRLAAFVLRRFHRPELQAGAPFRLGAFHTGAHQVVDIARDMKPQLGVHVALEVLAPEDLHDRSGSAPSTPATSAEKRFQDASSALSCFLPAAVSE